MSHLYAVQVKATGEVRDADGNLVNTVEVDDIKHMTEAELREAGLGDEEIDNIKKGGQR